MAVDLLIWSGAIKDQRPHDHANNPPRPLYQQVKWQQKWAIDRGRSWMRLGKGQFINKGGLILVAVVHIGILSSLPILDPPHEAPPNESIPVLMKV